MRTPHEPSPPTTESKPPIYTIDLSLLPSERYTEVVTDFQHAIEELPLLFDAVCASFVPPVIPLWLIHFLAWLFLRRLYSTEQTQELAGISKTCGVPMYLLVAYNVLLDLLMGCTSGGILVQDDNAYAPYMCHFRTLDWGMPALRKVLVQYDFVSSPDGPVAATTIGYVGFVGVLTGVKQNLSVSLNFRPYRHASTSAIAGLEYYTHLVCVLLGFRPSVSALLRDVLLPEVQVIKSEGNNALDDIENMFQHTPSAAAYLTFCTGRSTTIIEKDFRSAHIRRSEEFAAVTNHDLATESRNHSQERSAIPAQRFLNIGMQDLIDESKSRKRCLVRKWTAWQRKQVRNSDPSDSRSNGEARMKGVSMRDLRKWMLAYPVCNEDTHFVCVMDPMRGCVRWVRRFDDGDIGA